MLSGIFSNKPHKVMIALSMALIRASVCAEKNLSVVPMVSTLDNNQTIINDIRSTPNSFVALDFSLQNAESWDSRDRPVNQVFNCMNGDSITGFEFSNVTIETFAGSFFSEAVIYFSDSDRGDDGIRFIIGANNPNSGTNTFSSDGIIDITDLGIDDVVSRNDDQFFMQFYEETDDISGVVDARYTQGILKVWGIDLIPVEGCPFIEMEAQEPDLSVTYSVSDDSDEPTVGNVIDFDIAITNQGTGIADNIMIQHQLSPKLRFKDFSCDDGSQFGDDNALMSVDNIEPNSTLQCTLSALILTFGEITNDITVQANNDSDVNNNDASITINGAPVVIPVNNWLALLLLLSAMALITWRTITHRTA